METTKLAAALVAFQGELEAVEKTADNPFFKSKYADLATVKLAVQPLLKKHGLAVTQFPTHVDGAPALRTRVIHASGEFDEDTMLLVMAKQDPQGQGSALTYARRYAFMSVLGIVADEDDDGNQASVKPPKYRAASKVKEVMGGGEVVSVDHPKSNNAPTGKQLIAIRGYLHSLEITKEQRDKIVEQVTTFDKASALIEELKGKVERKKAAEAN